MTSRTSLVQRPGRPSSNVHECSICICKKNWNVRCTSRTNSFETSGGSEVFKVKKLSWRITNGKSHLTTKKIQRSVLMLENISFLFSLFSSPLSFPSFFLPSSQTSGSMRDAVCQFVDPSIGPRHSCWNEWKSKSKLGRNPTSEVRILPWILCHVFYLF